MYVSNHGGGCCGIRHISGFHIGPIESHRYLQRVLDNSESNAPRGRLIEIVLTDAQARNYGPILGKHKFVLASRFRNANSGNICNVFHRHEDLLPLDDIPFSMDPKVVDEMIEEDNKRRERRAALYTKRKDAKKRNPSPRVYDLGDRVVIVNRNALHYGRAALVIGVSGMMTSSGPRIKVRPMGCPAPYNDVWLAPSSVYPEA